MEILMAHNFAALKQQYPAVISQMKPVFNAHEFILELARQNQTLYVEALYSYKGGNPFQAVHHLLADLLNESPQVQRHGYDPDSPDIWTKHKGCSRWQKI